jgi:hypothetical protein
LNGIVIPAKAEIQGPVTFGSLAPRFSGALAGVTEGCFERNHRRRGAARFCEPHRPSRHNLLK